MGNVKTLADIDRYTTSDAESSFIYCFEYSNTPASFGRSHHNDIPRSNSLCPDRFAMI
jgi:hypothetical protein